MKKVASIAVQTRNKAILYLRREDNNKWTLPGGHFEGDETPVEAAVRELWEETGIEVKAKDLKALGHGIVNDKYEVHSFLYRMRPPYQEIHFDNDPDNEASEHCFFEDSPENAYVPEGKNVTLILMGEATNDGSVRIVEKLDKMAIKDLKPGEHVGSGEHDYSHLLPDDWRTKLHLKVAEGTVNPDSGKPDTLYTYLEPHDSPGRHIGHVEAFVEDNHIEPHSDLDADYHGKKLGQAMYEALYAHSLHKLGIKGVVGSYHSTASSRVHEALARKHGLNYKPGPVRPEYGGSLINDRGPYKYRIDKNESYVKPLVDSLTDDLRRPPYKGNENHLTGHCYVASEALYHLMGGKDSGWVPHNIKHEGSPHWYLKNKNTGEILDPTAGQFKTPVPYHMGRGKGFLTKEPSKRAQDLMGRIRTKMAAKSGEGIGETVNIVPVKKGHGLGRPVGEPHPHDNAVWAEQLPEDLVKGKKDALAMYKPEHAGHATSAEHVKWAYSTMPNENWSLWTVRHHRDKPQDFTPEVKNTIETYAANTHVPEIGNVRFDKSHTLHQGLDLLKNAHEQYIKRFKENTPLTEKPKDAKKVLDFGDGSAWWDLQKSQCAEEGDAMGHCGNAGNPQEGDSVYSLRTEHDLAGTKYHEPHLTFIRSGNMFGEMKGRGNEKPAAKYHDKIVALLNHTKAWPTGGGYAPENNFNLGDLAPDKMASFGLAMDKPEDVGLYANAFPVGHHGHRTPDFISHTHNPEAIKRHIAEHGLEFGILSNSHVPSDLLHQHRTPKNTKYVVQHRNVSPETVKQSIDDLGGMLSHFIAKSPALTPELIDYAIAQKGDSDFRFAHLLGSPKATEGNWLNGLQKDSEFIDRIPLYDAQESAGFTPKVANLVFSMAREHDQFYDLASNPKVSPQSIVGALRDLNGRDENRQIKILKATPHIKDPEVWSHFMSLSPSARSSVAVRAEHMTPEHREAVWDAAQGADHQWLADEWSYTHTGDAPKVTPTLAHKIATHDDPFVRRIASKLDLPDETRMALLNDPASEVRVQTALHPKTPDSMVEKTFSNLSEDGQYFVVANRRVSPQMAELALKSGLVRGTYGPEVRNTLALSAQTPAHVLKEVINLDASRRVYTARSAMNRTAWLSSPDTADQATQIIEYALANDGKSDAERAGLGVGALYHQHLPVDTLHKVIDFCEEHRNHQELDPALWQKKWLADAMWQAMQVNITKLPGDIHKRIVQIENAELGQTPELQKKTPPLFPKLGVNDNRRSVAIIDTPRQAEIQHRGQVQHFENKFPGVIDAKLQRDLPPSMSAGMVSTTNPDHGMVLSSKMRENTFPFAEHIHGNPGVNATEQHEGLHAILGRALDKYMSKRYFEGYFKTPKEAFLKRQEHRARLSMNLINAINSQISPEHAKAWDDYATRRNGGFPTGARGLHEHEEKLAGLFNFLNNPKERQAYANYVRPWAGDVRNGLHDAAMKAAYKAFQNVAPTVTQRWFEHNIKSHKLGKNVAGAVAGMALGQASPQLKQAFDKVNPPAQVQHLKEVPKPPENETKFTVATAESAPKWSPDGLHNLLIPVAHLESSFGKNMNHAPNSKGEFHTAFGPVGFKPSTAHEEWSKTKKLQELYPGLQDPADFMNKFKNDWKFYNLVASSHFMRLMHRHGSAEKAAYAWRWGTGACSGAAEDAINNDNYVMRYRDLAASTGINQKPALKKMAIKDISLGKDAGPDFEWVGHKFDTTGNVFDYSHVLPKKHRKDYKLIVTSHPDHRVLHGLVYPKGAAPDSAAASHVWGGTAGRELIIENASTLPDHAGKGLGMAAYEAIMAHAYHRHGAREVAGDSHSSLAARTHQKIAEKHGLEYPYKEADTSGGKPGDGKFGHYGYRMK